MNGKIQLFNVKNETTHNTPFVLGDNILSSGISLISLWHVFADESYRERWPQDKKKPLITNSWIAVYTVQGCGKIFLKDKTEITLDGNCVMFLKPIEISSYHCAGSVWEQYWMEFIPTNVMDITVLQKKIIHDGKLFNKEMREVTRLISSADPLENSLAVALLTKIIYQWIYLIAKSSKKDPRVIKLEKLISALHTNPEKDWSVAEMAQWMQCSEPYLRRLFLRYTGKTPKEYHLNARLELALSLLKQGKNTVSQVADRLNFFDAFHFSKAFKLKFGYAPSVVLRKYKQNEKDLFQER